MIEPSSGFVRATQNGSDQLKVRPGSRLSFFVHKKISENTWIISLHGHKIRVNSDIPLELGKNFRAVVLRQEGRVVLKFQVLPDGSVGDIFVESSSGYSSLDEAAMAGVKNWVFYPATRGDQPVTVTVEKTVVFQMERR